MKCEVRPWARVPGETAKRDVRCDFKPASLHLEVGTMPEGDRVIVDGSLPLCFEAGRVPYRAVH